MVRDKFVRDFYLYYVIWKYFLGFYWSTLNKNFILDDKKMFIDVVYVFLYKNGMVLLIIGRNV